MLRDKQLRLVYSLLKPALRMAARFNVPVRAIADLVRLGYYEVLAKQGLSGMEIARVFDQTPRHMRSLAQRLNSDFFAAETDVGIVREVEEAVALNQPTKQQLPKLLPAADPEALDAAVAQLLSDERIEIGEDGHLSIGRRYVVMTSDGFNQRIDALNHHLDGLYRAAVQRLIHDERRAVMIKTITISACPDELDAYLKKLEGELRRELAALEESATFAGQSGQRFTLGLAVSAADPELKEN
ncbi:hypothetical protein [Sorangium sp. So ce1182]|uniref:hypothetical protein n=1 Tax=Sorangium sp. So ce1182 TaxID=3133334 RepID=UPI003F6275C5